MSLAVNSLNFSNNVQAITNHPSIKLMDNIARATKIDNTYPNLVPLQNYTVNFKGTNSNILEQQEIKTNEYELKGINSNNAKTNNSKEVHNSVIEAIAESSNVQKSPSFNLTNKHDIIGDNFNISIKDTMNYRKVNGTIKNNELDLKLGSNFWSLSKGEIKGSINGENVEIKYSMTDKGIKLEGLPDSMDIIKDYIAFIALQKIRRDIQVDHEMAMGAMMCK